MVQDYHSELKTFLVSSKGNKIVSSRCNRDYFIKHNKEYLWNYINEFTKSAKDDLTLSDRIWYAFNNIKPQRCKVCNLKYTSVSRDSPNNKPRIYCSSSCQYKDPEISSIIKTRRKKVDHATANQRRKQTMLERFGVEYNSQRESVKKRLSSKTSERQLPKEILDKLNDKDWIYHHYIELKKPSTVIAEELGGIFYGTVLTRVEKFGFEINPYSPISYEEQTLVDFIDSLGIKYLHQTKKVISPYELDIYIPEYKLAIEYNGLFWHSESKYNQRQDIKKLHLTKTEMCSNLGVNLFHVNSDWWINKPDIVKSMIKNKLGLSNSIYARNCKIVELNNAEQLKFNSINHLQGGVNSVVSYGLLYNNQLVQVITFGKPRFNNNYNWELLRLSTLNSLNVVGGASKLFKHFENNHKGSILSYCDRQYSNGNVYYKLGFKLDRITKPGYYWTDTSKLYHRSNFMKHKLEKQLKIFDSKLSESENMFNNNYKRYWDCGQMVFTKE